MCCFDKGKYNINTRSGYDIIKVSNNHIKHLKISYRYCFLGYQLKRNKGCSGATGGTLIATNGSLELAVRGCNSRRRCKCIYCLHRLGRCGITDSSATLDWRQITTESSDAYVSIFY